jgi:hypothetical protein
MKYLLVVLLLVGCGGSSEKEVAIEQPEEVVYQPDIKIKYIVAGQSNASQCDWAYFEELTGSEVINLSLSGYPIKRLINETDYSNIKDAKAIIFVHGEADSISGMNGIDYVELVKNYQGLLGDVPLYISTVGYYDKIDDVYFDEIRNAVSDEASKNNNWFISFNNAQYFREWGMLSDGIHFTDEGCRMMMDAFAEQTYKL